MTSKFVPYGHVQGCFVHSPMAFSFFDIDDDDVDLPDTLLLMIADLSTLARDLVNSALPSFIEVILKHNGIP